MERIKRGLAPVLLVPTFWFLAQWISGTSRPVPQAFGPYPTMRMCQQAQDRIDIQPFLRASSSSDGHNQLVIPPDDKADIIDRCAKVEGWK